MENITIDEFCGSKLWDWNSSWYTDDPKLSDCFEKTVLVWAPCAFLWIFSTLEMGYQFMSKHRDIPWNPFNVTKMFLITAIIVHSLTDLGVSIHLSSSEHFTLYDVDLYTPIIKASTFSLVAVLVLLNRKCGIRTSFIQFLFWSLCLLCGISQLLTEIMQTKQQELSPVTEFNISVARVILQNDEEVKPYYFFVSYMVYYSCVVMLFVLSWFADASPRFSHYPKSMKPCPEESSGSFSRLWLFWIDPLIYKGYKKPIEFHDLWDMKPEDTAREIIPIFDSYWKPTKKQSKIESDVAYKSESANVNFSNSEGQKKETSVLPALLKTFWKSILLDSLLKLTVDVLIFVNPQLLRLLIEFVEQNDYLWKGYLYAFGIFIAGMVYTMICAQFHKRLFSFGMRIKTLITSMVYRKALSMSNAAKKQSTVGEIVNLMAVDTQRFVDLMYNIHMTWAVPMQILLSLYFLYNLLGVSVFVGFSVMLVLIPVNAYIANRTKVLQMKQMKTKDERTKLMNEILNGMKVLKLYAWEPSFSDQVLSIRDKELDVRKKSIYLNAGTSFIWHCAPFIVSLVTFATYVLIDETNVLDASKAFVSIALFNILRWPLVALPGMITSYIQAMVSVKRMNKFMNGDDLHPDNVQHDSTEKDSIIIENGSFNWSEGPVLINANIRCAQKSLTAVVGTIGSGKSSLISAILGEMEKTSGRVNTIGSIAYVAQHAWIQNATLHDNILFGRPFNQKLYDAVIEACALRQDLEMLPAGDQTEIGEKGINLSGGQKQRVSLARAVYSNSDVYLLDDPLSAVDSHVGKHIFEEVIGPNGLLKSKTRILVTNAITYLPQMDQIVVLARGTVSDTGTYDELMGKMGDFAEFINNYKNNTEEGDSDGLTNDTNTKRNVPDYKRSVSKIAASSSESLRKENGVRHRKSSSNSNHVLPEEDEATGDKLIEDEKVERGKVKWGVYKHYLLSIGLKFSVLTVVFTMISNVLSVSANICLSIWSTDLEATGNNTSKRDMYLGIYGFLGILQAFATILSSLCPYLGCWIAAKSLHSVMLHSVLRSPLSFFETTPLGRILARFSKDLDDIDNRLPLVISISVVTLFQVLSTIVVISYTIPIFISAILPIGVIYYMIQRFYIASSRQLKRLDSITKSPVYSHFGESISGATTIRAFNKQADFINVSDGKVDRNQVYHYACITSNQWLAIRLEFIGNLIMLFAALSAVLGKDQNAGLVGLSITYALQVTHNLNWLVRLASEIEMNIVAVERIKEYSELPSEAAWEVPNNRLTSTWPDSGTVTFRDYSLKYREGLETILKRINFSILGGEKIGIVGRTGAGKSSLTLGLFRILEATEGEILIDGVSIAQLGLHFLRSRLTIIPQDNVLFSGSLRMNLDPFNKHTDEDLWKALKNAHLKNFIEELPSRLNHELSEGGDNLSAGQRQLICLARALLRKTKILVLDEATAAVDLETDDLIQRTIATEFRDCTVLTIAHRLNTVIESDRVMVLDKGELAEFDTPQKLLRNTKSIFYGMCKDAGLV